MSTGVFGQFVIGQDHFGGETVPLGTYGPGFGVGVDPGDTGAAVPLAQIPRTAYLLEL
ncbi:unnamed protein product, partial [marine sediment metagenome]